MAEKITLVTDKINIHMAAWLYKTFPLEKACWQNIFNGIIRWKMETVWTWLKLKSASLQSSIALYEEGGVKLGGTFGHLGPDVVGRLQKAYRGRVGRHHEVAHI